MPVVAWATTLATATMAIGSETDSATVLWSDSSRIVRLPAIEVSAVRPQEDHELRRRVTFARAYDVRQSHGRVRTVADVISTATGVHVRQFGGTGSYGAVSIRGSSSAQVAAYLDGVPLNSAQYGVLNIADLPIEAIERIEVYRGPAPLGFESPGGGAINLVTQSADGRWLRAAAGRGSFGTERGDLAAGGRWRRTAALGVVQYLDSRGNFPYFDDNATPYNSDDDTVRTRANNDVSLLGVTARVEQGIGPLSLSLTHDHVSKDQGVPGIGANPTREARFRTERDLASLRLAWDREGHSRSRGSSVALRAYGLRQRDRFSDRLGELMGVRQDNDDRTLRWGSQLTASASLPRGHRLGLGADARREEYAPALNMPTRRELSRSRRDVLALAAEDTWDLGARASLMGSVRRQATFDDFPGGSAYPGAYPVPPRRIDTWQTSWTGGARVDLLGGLAAKGSVSALSRLPTLEELFGNRAGIFGNPSARPERILTRDIGLVGLWTKPAISSPLRPAWVDAQFSIYRSDAADLLLYVQNSQRSSVAQNISGARLWGTEANLRAAWGGGLSAEASWTRQWTRDESEVAYWRGLELPGRPRDEASLEVSYACAAWQVGYAHHVITANYQDRANLARVPTRSLHDLTASVRTTPIEWTAECVNLTDRRVEDFAGYPLPGRAFFLGARFRIIGRGALP